MGRRCRCSRSRLPRSRPPWRWSPRRRRGSRTPGRSCRCRAPRLPPCARATSRRASRPPWTRGCSVLTRPSIISGKPVRSSIGRTGTPASASALAVPPVETISTPNSVDERAAELDDAGLVGDRDERALDGDVGHGDWLPCWWLQTVTGRTAGGPADSRGDCSVSRGGRGGRSRPQLVLPRAETDEAALGTAALDLEEAMRVMMAIVLGRADRATTGRCACSPRGAAKAQPLHAPYQCGALATRPSRQCGS